MVEFKCLGHDSRHVCRSVLVAPGGFLLDSDDCMFFAARIRDLSSPEQL